MGGTFTAIGDGAEACYYNPAGLTQLKISYISVSAQVFEYKQISGRFIADPKEKLTSQSFVPSFWGFAKDIGKYKFGFSIVVPEYDAYKMHEQYSDLQLGSITFDKIRTDQINNNQTYLIGPSIAREINPKLSIGATTYFRYSDISERNDYYYEASVSGNQLIRENTSENSGKGLGGLGIVGLLYKPQENLHLGLSYKTGSHVTNKIDVIRRNYVFKSWVSSNPFNPYYLEKQVEYSSTVPPSTILGIKWQPVKKLTLSTDISYITESNYIKESYELNTDTTTGITDYQHTATPIKMEDIINVNFGSEYMLANNVPFRFGFFTDRSTAPKIKDNNTPQPMHIDNYGVSFSSGVFTQNSTMVFGVKYGWGNGQMTNLDFSNQT